MTRCLIIDEEAKERIRKVKEYGEINFFALKDVVNLIQNKICVGDNPNYRCFLHEGYKCVYSIMQVPKKDNPNEPAGWFRQFSVSIDGPGYPHEEAVKALAREFGFNKDFKNCGFYIEEASRACAVIEKIDQNGI